MRSDWRNIRPDVAGNLPRIFAQITLAPGPVLPGIGIPDTPLGVQLRHRFLGITPTFGRRLITAPFVHQVGAGIRTCNIAQCIGTFAVIVVMAVELGHIIGIQRNAHSVDIYATAVAQYVIGDTAESLRVVMRRRSFPGNLRHKTAGSINAVQQQFEVMAGGRVAVQVDRTGVFQHAAHFQQAHGHHTQIRLHPLAVGQAGGGQRLVQRRLLVGNQPHPCHIQIGERPGIFKSGAGGGAADGSGIVAVRVERRVQIDQVNRCGVKAAQDVQVIARPDGFIGEVSHCDCFTSSVSRRPGQRFQFVQEPFYISDAAGDIFGKVPVFVEVHVEVAGNVK